MIVTKEQYFDVLHRLSKPGAYGADTETTGLQVFNGDRLFSIILAEMTDAGPLAYYFNFNHYVPESPDRLPVSYFKDLNAVFGNKDSLFFLHNAKFDIGMLDAEGISIKGRIHCTQAMARVLLSWAKSYSLDACLERYSEETGDKSVFKIDTIKKWIIDNKKFHEVTLEGKPEPKKMLHYHEVPLEMIQPYAEMDTIACMKLGMWQRNQINAEPSVHRPSAHLESALTPICYQMEKNGIQLDVPKVRDLMAKDQIIVNSLTAEFKRQTGIEFVDSRIVLAKVFDSIGESYPKTAKGQDSFDEDALSAMQHPIAKKILDIRKASKKISTYYSNFLQFSDSSGVVHPNMRQDGTQTGRFSYWEPNLQNIPKPDEDDLEDAESNIVRDCFIPSPGTFLGMFDYDQMEFKFLLDQAEEMPMIRKILDHGLDVHAATGEMMGVSRKTAKTINFMLLYGGGAAKLAIALGVSLGEAQKLKAAFLAALPRVSSFMRLVTNKAKMSGYCYNWIGRRYNVDKKFAYRAPNYVIQGGCAMVVKKAMVEVAKFIEPYRTKLLLQVHDELLFGFHPKETDLIPEIKRIMESQYPYRHLPLTVGFDHSYKSWARKTKGLPI